MRVLKSVRSVTRKQHCGGGGCSSTVNGERRPSLASVRSRWKRRARASSDKTLTSASPAGARQGSLRLAGGGLVEGLLWLRPLGLAELGGGTRPCRLARLRASLALLRAVTLRSTLDPTNEKEKLVVFQLRRLECVASLAHSQERIF